VSPKEDGECNNEQPWGPSDIGSGEFKARMVVTVFLQPHLVVQVAGRVGNWLGQTRMHI
jgi:hypothetical protein